MATHSREKSSTVRKRAHWNTDCRGEWVSKDFLRGVWTMGMRKSRKAIDSAPSHCPWVPSAWRGGLQYQLLDASLWSGPAGWLECATSIPTLDGIPLDYLAGFYRLCSKWFEYANVCVRELQKLIDLFLSHSGWGNKITFMVWFLAKFGDCDTSSLHFLSFLMWSQLS